MSGILSRSYVQKIVFKSYLQCQYISESQMHNLTWHYTLFSGSPSKIFMNFIWRSEHHNQQNLSVTKFQQNVLYLCIFCKFHIHNTYLYLLKILCLCSHSKHLSKTLAKTLWGKITQVEHYIFVLKQNTQVHFIRVRATFITKYPLD